MDEVLTMHRGTADYYFHTDDLYNVVAVTDASGAVVERYEYDDYGQPSVFDGAGNPLPNGTAIGNLVMFQGRLYDPETGYYWYRTRYFDPTTGRFTSRDTIGIWGDPTNLGNGYTFVANNPWTMVDPFGLWEQFGMEGDPRVTEAEVKAYAGVAKGLYDFVSGTVKGVWELAGMVGSTRKQIDVATGLATQYLLTKHSLETYGGESPSDARYDTIAAGAASLLQGGRILDMQEAYWQDDIEGMTRNATAGGLNILAMASAACAAKDAALAGGAAKSAGGLGSGARLQVRVNKAMGDAWEKELIESILPETQTAIRPQITIRSAGPSDLRVRLDALGMETKSGALKMTDAKASPTAGLTPNQVIVYPELELFGGTVVGKGKPPYVGGTVIPPTRVDVVRKP